MEQIVAQTFSVAVGFEFWVSPLEWNLWPAPNRDGHGKDMGDLLMPTVGQGKVKGANAWHARDEFFRLKPGDNESLLKFFNKWGQWTSDSVDEAVSVREVWQIRERFRRAVLSPMTEWLTDPVANIAPLAVFLPRTEYPHFFFSTMGCLLAMHTTITFDLMRSVKFRPCARKDCRTPYSVESAHKRSYCSQYCGHLVGLREKRDQAKKAAKAAAREARGKKHA